MATTQHRVEPQPVQPIYIEQLPLLFLAKSAAIAGTSRLARCEFVKQSSRPVATPLAYISYHIHVG